MNAKTRVLVIGLDGATLDLIEPWAQAGHLPNLHNLMQRGTYARMKSVTPVISAAAWVTFMTGSNPGKHGIYDFVARETDSYRLRPTSAREIRLPTLWNLLSQQNKRVFVMNVPLTYPPEPVNGILISGLGAPNLKTFTYPEALSKTLWARGYRVNRKIFYAYQNREAFLQDTEDLITHITANAEDFLRQEAWDFAMVVYRETDDVPHGFWHDMDPTHPQHNPNSPYRDVILNLYKSLDSAVGRLIAAAGEDVQIFIVSDHGFGALYKDVYLNEFLRQKGYLYTHSGAVSHNLFSRIGLTRSNVSRLLRKMGMEWLERRIKDTIGDKIELLPRDQFPDFRAGIDWSRTRAYSYGYQGQIFVNLKGREPQGIMPPEEYAALLNDLERDLQSLRDPEDNQPVVDTVSRASQLYTGNHTAAAPDLVLEMRGLSYITRLGYELGHAPGQIFGLSRVHETGGHRPEGVWMAAGTQIAALGAQNESTHLSDPAPTILHLLGCPIPTWMDGSVRITWLTGAAATRPPEYRADLSEDFAEAAQMSREEQAEMMQRLKDLGYL